MIMTMIYFSNITDTNQPEVLRMEEQKYPQKMSTKTVNSNTVRLNLETLF
jgi:hypothetical protein